MISRLFVWDFEDAHRHDIEVVDHHVKLTSVGLLSSLILPAKSIEGQMVQLKSQIALDHV